jgi:ERCC4-related helicase
MSDPSWDTGARVDSDRFGIGTIQLDKGPTAIIRFEHGLEECDKQELRPIASPHEVLNRKKWDVPLELVNRLQAESIHSVNDTWGVFSRSRIELLPHQLWVCRKVNSTWPTRWLVADDVGLGKTIEAGMILWPLLSRGTVRRLLIICPAHLVEQWQYRMRTIFDIRLAMYAPEADTVKSDFWGTHPYVVASLHTLRLDRTKRHKRMLEADPWDLVIVDEAHHLNADEQHGFTLGYRLLKKLVDNNRTKSVIFFTGTPHRGKNYGFLALLNLLRPDLFSLQKSLHAQLPKLSQVMIRNNKSRVTDITGNRLFHEPEVRSETFSFSPEEGHFYDLLTRFIVDGQAYASGLESTQGRAVMLVLVAMQKLASSSTAAIRRAIKKRLARVKSGQEDLKKLQEDYREAEQNQSLDQMSSLEEKIVEVSSKLMLMRNEEPRLRELLAAAEEIQDETKVEKLMTVLDEQFKDRSVLFFTEYKATQALLMSALMKRFGEGCVCFINGDERLDEVLYPSGEQKTVACQREEAAEQLNEGRVRFLISTEAGGEGIDLQESCYTLVHVDLPWNPMRLHQRVGRLNRYGQKHRVDVLNLRNPDTVESRIWEKLNEKIARISLAFGQVMDEPEDLLQLVLGMTSPSMFRNLYAGATRVDQESLSDWFNDRTAQFGGRDVIEAVKDLVGNSAKFDFHQVSDRLPKTDLPDLKFFLDTSLSLNGRRLREDAEGLSFLTPDNWKTEPGVSAEYKGMQFDRNDRSSEAAKRLLGVGHKIVNQALEQACSREAVVASMPSEDLAQPTIVFRVRDKVTGSEKPKPRLVVGLQPQGGSEFTLLQDWELLLWLNQLPVRRSNMKEASASSSDIIGLTEIVQAAERFLAPRLKDLDSSLRYPYAELSGLLVPLAD